MFSVMTAASPMYVPDTLLMKHLRQGKGKASQEHGQRQVDDAEHEEQCKTGFLQAVKAFAQCFDNRLHHFVEAVAQRVHRLDAPWQCDVILAIAAASHAAWTDDIAREVNAEGQQDGNRIGNGALIIAVRPVLDMAVRARRSAERAVIGIATGVADDLAFFYVSFRTR